MTQNGKSSLSIMKRCKSLKNSKTYKKIKRSKTCGFVNLDRIQTEEMESQYATLLMISKSDLTDVNATEMASFEHSFFKNTFKIQCYITRENSIFDTML